MKKWYAIYFYYVISGIKMVYSPIHLFSETEEDVLIQNIVNSIYEFRRQHKILLQPNLIQVECLQSEGESAGKKEIVFKPLQGSKISTALFQKWIMTKDIAH